MPSAPRRLATAWDSSQTLPPARRKPRPLGDYRWNGTISFWIYDLRFTRVCYDRRLSLARFRPVQAEAPSTLRSAAALHAAARTRSPCSFAPASWTAVGSEAPHRFRANEGLGWFVGVSPARKRRRRCALPAHSTTLRAHGAHVPSHQRLGLRWPSTALERQPGDPRYRAARFHGLGGAMIGVFRFGWPTKK